MTAAVAPARVRVTLDIPHGPARHHWHPDMLAFQRTEYIWEQVQWQRAEEGLPRRAYPVPSLDGGRHRAVESRQPGGDVTIARGRPWQQAVRAFFGGVTARDWLQAASIALIAVFVLFALVVSINSAGFGVQETGYRPGEPPAMTVQVGVR